jgi:amino acid transporter
MSGIGIILGAGIYVLVGVAAGEAGNGVWIAFAIAAIIAAPTGLAFAELAAMFPEAGASAAYAREALGVRFGFITGWLDLAVSVIGAAAVAIGFGRYFDDLATGGVAPIAILVLIASGIITYIGVRETITIAVIFTVLEATGLIIVIAVGIPEIGGSPLFEIEGGWLGVLGAASLVYFAYQGFEEIATLSEETIAPERTIPRAIVVAVIVTTTLYMLVSIAAVSSLPWQQLAESDAPLADVVQAVSSDRLADVISAIALFATFNTVLLLIATGARLTYGMANRRLLPTVLARVSKRRGTPWLATLVITALAIGLAATGDISFVAQITNFSVFGLFALVNASVIALRFKRPDANRPFQISWNFRGVPLIAVLGLAGNLMLALFMDWDAFRAGLIVLAVGVLGSFIAVRYERDPA